MQNKYFRFLIIALAVAVIVPQVALASWWNPMSWGWLNRIFHFQRTEQKQEQQIKKDETPIVGGDKDAHGCIGSAGYSWCEAKQKCLRQWEEACDISNDVYPVFANGSFKWSNESVKTINEPITNLVINGFEITATGKINKNTNASEFFSYYDTKLKEAGWTVDNNFAADGVKGSQVGYKKDSNFIVLSYNIKPGKVISGTNEPLQYTCPCDVTYTIFTSSKIK